MASEPFNQNVYSSEPRPRVRKQTKSIKRKGECRKDVYKNVNATSDSSSESSSYFTKSKQEEVVVDDGALDTSHTVYETVVHLIMRLSSRWTKDETEYLESTCNTPVTLFNDDGKDNMFFPISCIQRMTKLWRKEIVENNNRVMTLSELNHVEKLLGECKNKQQRLRNSKVDPNDLDMINDIEPLDENKIQPEDETREWAKDTFRDTRPSDTNCHFVSTDIIADLPTLNVSFQNTNGSFTGFQCCPDTGSQISLMSVKTMERLGFSLNDINQTNN